MPATLRPSRLDVTDRYPMLAFTLQSPEGPRIAEVVLASDLALFSKPEGRRSDNFFSSREHGILTVPPGGAVYTVPPLVLARFITANRLYFALATASAPGGQDWRIDVMPGEASPYVSLSGLSDRALRRVRMFPASTRGRMATPPMLMEWAGDKIAQPTPAGAIPAAAPGAGTTAPAAPTPYNDGFGPLPPLQSEAPVASSPAPDPAFAPETVPTAQGLGDGSGIDPETRGIEAGTYTEAVAPAAASALDLTAADYPRTARIVPSPAFTSGRAGTAIDRIVIHITDAPTTSSTVNTFSNAGAQASAHYLVGQDGEIVQFVSEADTAWHARGANRRSVGIEHVAIKAGGADYPRRDGSIQHFDALPPTDTQYCESAALVSYLCQKYGLTADRTTIIGHNEADPTTTHGACPTGNWNWDHFMRLVTEQVCAPQPTGQSLGTTTANAMVFGREDFDKIREKHAGDFRDLFQWRVPASIQSQIEGRGFRIQKLEDAVGYLNLDFYKVRINRFPPGMDGPALLSRFISNINNFVSSDICRFDPYDSSDAALLASADARGACLKLDINSGAFFFDPRGWDDAAVVICDKGPHDQPTQFYSVTTINTPATGDHPVSGHRQFGFYTDEGVTYFYTRGADRATLAFPGTEGAIYSGGEALWQSFQHVTSAFINQLGGEATIVPPFSERFNPSAIRLEFGGYGESQAQSFAADPEDGEISGPVHEIDPTAPAQTASALALTDAEYPDAIVMPSPAFTRGRAGQAIDRIVIHITSSRQSPYLGSWFTRPDANSSAHYMVDQLGVVRQFVSEADTSWHAGNRTANRRSIGIEHVAVEQGGAVYGETRLPYTPPTDIEYQTSAGVVAHLCRKYNLTPDRTTIIGHSEVNPATTHSSCPNGAWDWERYMALVTVAYALQTGVSAVGSVVNTVRGAVGLAADDWSINWDGVQMIPQPTDNGCWATAAAIVIGWRDNQSVSPALLAQYNGMDSSLRGGLLPADKRAFINAVGLQVHPNACYTPDGFRDILEANGPVWVTADVPGIHAIVVTGMYRENGNYYVRITDPWDRVVGTPGNQGAYAQTHATGSQYIMTYDAFTAEFEAAGNIDRIQLAHSGSTFGHTINRGSASGAGYAQGLARGLARGLGDEAAVKPAIVMTPVPLDLAGAVTRTTASDGGRSYDLAQLAGMIRPANALAGGAGMTPIPGERVLLTDWPYIDSAGGRVQAGLAIDWKFDGAAVGEIVIAPTGGSVADGWIAAVRADIVAGSGTPDRTALLVRVTTIFSLAGQPDQTGVSEVTLGGDGRAATRHCGDGSEAPATPPAAAAPVPQPVPAREPVTA